MRCTACNGTLAEAAKETVQEQLADGTERSYDVFARCTDCGQVYWRGAHHARLTAIVDEALAVGVLVMDTNAFVLANEQSLTMHVFDVAADGVMRAICEGADLGTRISAKG